MDKREPQRTDLIGRNPEAVAYQLEKLRAMTVEQRAKVLFDLIESARIMREATETPKTDRMNFLEHLDTACEALEKCGIPYVLGGSMASSMWGHMRQTNDADLAIVATLETPSCLRTHLGPDYIIFPSDWSELILDRNYPCGEIMNTDGNFRCDLFLTPDDAYSKGQFERAVPTDVGTGRLVPICSAEDIVLHKFRWYEMGNRVSDRQWNDVVQVLEVQAGRLDLDYLRQWATHFGVAELLQTAFQQAQR